MNQIIWFRILIIFTKFDTFATFAIFTLFSLLPPFLLLTLLPLLVIWQNLYSCMQNTSFEWRICWRWRISFQSIVIFQTILNHLLNSLWELKQILFLKIFDLFDDKFERCSKKWRNSEWKRKNRLSMVVQVQTVEVELLPSISSTF